MRLIHHVYGNTQICNGDMYFSIWSSIGRQTGTDIVSQVSLFSKCWFFIRFCWSDTSLLFHAKCSSTIAIWLWMDRNNVVTNALLQTTPYVINESENIACNASCLWIQCSNVYFYKTWWAQNDDQRDGFHTWTSCHTCAVYVLVMTWQEIVQCWRWRHSCLCNCKARVQNDNQLVIYRYYSRR